MLKMNDFNINYNDNQNFSRTVQSLLINDAKYFLICFLFPLFCVISLRINLPLLIYNLSILVRMYLIHLCFIFRLLFYTRFLCCFYHFLIFLFLTFFYLLNFTSIFVGVQNEFLLIFYIEYCWEKENYFIISMVVDAQFKIRFKIRLWIICFQWMGFCFFFLLKNPIYIRI